MDRKTKFKEGQYTDAARKRAYEMVDDPKTQLLFDADAMDPDHFHEQMALPPDQRKYYKEISDEDYQAWQYGWDRGILDENYTGDYSDETLKANEEYESQYGYDRAVRPYRRLTDEEKAERQAMIEKDRKKKERRENSQKVRDMFGL